MGNISTTLKRYLEEVVARVGNKDQAKEIIDEEETRLTDVRELNELAKLEVVRDLTSKYGVPVETVRKVFTEATTLEDLAHSIEELTKVADAAFLIDHWRQYPEYQDTMNEVRTALHLTPLHFKDGRKSTKPKTAPKRSIEAKHHNDTDELSR